MPTKYLVDSDTYEAVNHHERNYGKNKKIADDAQQINFSHKKYNDREYSYTRSDTRRKVDFVDKKNWT